MTAIARVPDRFWIRLRRLLRGLLVGPCVVSALACGGSPAPVGRVTVSLDREVIPLGGPATLAVQFDVAATPAALAPLAEDHRVMVHFLDADGELMWAADHDPPIPTSEWQPGQRVSYTRRIRVPMYPYIGDATVAIGLYSETTGRRLPLVGEDVGQHAYRGTAVTLEPQPESSFLMYQDGWYDDEFDPQSGARWRWTGRRASLSFQNPASDATLYLEIDGRPELFDPPQKLTIRVRNDVVFEAWVDGGGRQFHEVTLTAEQLGGDETVSVVLEVDRTFVPSAIPGGSAGDDRTLGVRVFYAFLEPH